MRIRRGCCYHGLSLNVDMDLGPYQRINPCGYAGLQMTQLRELAGPQKLDHVLAKLLPHLATQLGLPLMKLESVETLTLEAISAGDSPAAAAL